MTNLIGVFDLFRIGLGPSSSHTVGPMRAARAFVAGAAAHAAGASRIEVILYGSLAWTGRGHGTDVAVLAGLAGMEPATAEPDAVHALPATIRESGRITLPGLATVPFDIERDLVFDLKTHVPGHPNAMRFRLSDAAGAALADELWYSIGGGHTIRDGDKPPTEAAVKLPYPFAHASEMLAMAADSGLSIAALQLANECALRPPAAVRDHIAQVLAAMESCIDRGLAGEGELPGGLKVHRRAKTLAARLAQARLKNIRRPNEASDHASLWAIAVNEENAVGGRVVTAPTNGAAGVVPAVLRYWRTYYEATTEAGEDFLLAAAAIGGLAKRNASISGAEVGCQGEVGVGLPRWPPAALCRGPGRHAGAGAQRRGNRAGAPSRHDLRPDRRAGPGAVHRAQRLRRREGDQRGVAGAVRRREASRQPRRGDRHDAPDRAGHARQVQGDRAGWTRGARDGMLMANTVP